MTRIAPESGIGPAGSGRMTFALVVSLLAHAAAVAVAVIHQPQRGAPEQGIPVEIILSGNAETERPDAPVKAASSTPAASPSQSPAEPGRVEGVEADQVENAPVPTPDASRADVMQSTRRSVEPENMNVHADVPAADRQAAPAATPEASSARDAPLTSVLPGLPDQVETPPVRPVPTVTTPVVQPPSSDKVPVASTSPRRSSRDSAAHTIGHATDPSQRRHPPAVQADSASRQLGVAAPAASSARRGSTKLADAIRPDALSDYLALVRARITSRRREAPASPGRTTLRFSVARDGSVSGVSVISGNRGDVGEAAVRQVTRASPVPPFPETIPRASMTMTVTIVFE